MMRYKRMKSSEYSLQQYLDYDLVMDWEPGEIPSFPSPNVTPAIQVTDRKFVRVK